MALHRVGWWILEHLHVNETERCKTEVLIEVMCPLLPATPMDIPNVFSFWEDRRPSHHPEPLQHISLVHSSQDVPLHSDYRPGQIESRLELLQAQLSR